MRLTGANQTTIQPGIFPLIKYLDTATSIPLSNQWSDGPFQLNIQFDTPLVDDYGVDWISQINFSEVSETKEKEIPKDSIEIAGKAIVVVGHDKGNLSADQINQFIKENNFPAISEDPFLNRELIPHASLILQDPKVREILKADTVITIGRTTLSRSINEYINLANHKIVIDQKLESVDIKRSADLLLIDLPKIKNYNANQNFLELWKKASHLMGGVIESDKSWSESRAVKTIFENLAHEHEVFVGSSRTIREVEGVIDYQKCSATFNSFANRGLAGIDGNISTIFGIAQYSRKVLGVMGDVTFLHDLSSLLATPANPTTLVVIDNNGGGIFNTLEQSNAPHFEEVFGTPHNRDLASLARGFGHKVIEVVDEISLQQALNNQEDFFKIIIIKVPNRNSLLQFLKDRSDYFCKEFLIGANLA